MLITTLIKLLILVRIIGKVLADNCGLSLRAWANSRPVGICLSAMCWPKASLNDTISSSVHLRLVPYLLDLVSRTFDVCSSIRIPEPERLRRNGLKWWSIYHIRWSSFSCSHFTQMLLRLTNNVHISIFFCFPEIQNASYPYSSRFHLSFIFFSVSGTY